MPLFFGKQLMDSGSWLPCLCMFFAFCLAASGVYCLNDVCDAEADRNHPEKCRRPIARGAVSSKTAYVVMAVCWLSSFGFVALGCSTDMQVAMKAAAILGLYIVMNIAYCLKLKNYSIVDVFIVAIGFVLRVLIGGVIAGIVLSQWLVLMTFLLALFIAFAKRRDDVLTYESSGEKMRKNVGSYNIQFINNALCIMASITIVCYIMYTVSEEVVQRIGSPYLYTTSVFVIAGILRYLQIAIVEEKSGSPTKVMLRDRFIQFCVAAWILTFACILYIN